MLTGCSEESVESAVENDVEGQKASIEEETEQNVELGENDDVGENEEEKEFPEETSPNTSEEDNDSNVPDNTIPATVVRVVDGDTLKATVDGKEETVRLVLVDTPETVHPSKPVQPFGPEASEFAEVYYTN